jgi:hypothetical protein
VDAPPPPATAPSAFDFNGICPGTTDYVWRHVGTFETARRRIPHLHLHRLRGSLTAETSTARWETAAARASAASVISA